MPKPIETTLRFPLVCVLFFLIVAVFAFVSHARVEFARTGASTTPYKVSREKRSATQAVEETIPNDPSTALEKFFSLQSVPVVDPLSIASLQLQQVESAFWQTSRSDSLESLFMLRPPPVQI
jgi:hypothetical protein